MGNKMIDFSIIIPAKNEEKKIKPTLVNYCEFFKNKKESFELWIILNNCSDKTEDIVKEVQKKYKQINYINFPDQIGKGGALLEGFKLVKGYLITYTDADGSTSPETLFELSRQIENYDGIIGSRWIKGAKILKKQPFSRRFASRGFNILTKIILGLNYKDTQCGAKVFKKYTIDKIKDQIKENTNWAIDAVLLFYMKKEGFKIREYPITWEDKEFSGLKIRKVILKMFITLLKTRFKN